MICSETSIKDSAEESGSIRVNRKHRNIRKAYIG